MYSPLNFEIREPRPPYYGSGSDQPTARQRLARNIRLLRTLRGWSQEALALEAGLDRSYVGSIERAERNPTLDNIEKLAVALDMEVEELLADIRI